MFEGYYNCDIGLKILIIKKKDIDSNRFRVLGSIPRSQKPL